MKKLLLIFSFFIFLSALRAQPYGNEWINTSQTYYKIQVAQDGIYRIPFAALQSISNISSAHAYNFALYHNGQSVPVYVSGDTLGTNDYIEFYGERNKGYIDSLLYRSANDQMNPDFSLFNDTSVYFLTLNQFPNPLRMQITQYNNNNPPNPETSFTSKMVAFSGKTYFDGKYYSDGTDELYKSIYEPGDGYANSSYFGNGGAQSFTVSTPALYSSGTNTLRARFAANSDGEFHNISIQLNNATQLYQHTDTGYMFHNWSTTISSSQLVNGNNTLTFSDFGNGISQHQDMVGFIEMDYQRQFDFQNSSAFYFELNGSGTKYLEINNFNSQGTQPLLYDLTNHAVYRCISPAGSSPLQFKITTPAATTQLFLRADVASAFTTVNMLTPINFATYQPSDYYIISNKNLMDDGTGYNPVNDYLVYRRTKFPNCQLADIDALYDQFSYGIRKSPLAIRNFISYAKHTFNMKYAFIIGKGRESYTMRTPNNPAAYNQCLVPTFGYPGSDNLLAATRSSDTMQVAIGRLPAGYRFQVTDYLNKMKLYEQQQDTDINSYPNDEAIPPKDWQKQILHFSGGTTSYEQSSFRAYEYHYAQIATDTSWGTDTTTFTKTVSAPIQDNMAETIKAKINEGVSWITFFGHAATGAFDISIDEPENYNNSPKFPIILSNGCFAGFIHDVDSGYSERFVMVPNKAAIAFMATANLSVPDALDIFSTNMYNNICKKNYLQTLGKSFQQDYNSVNSCCSNSDRDMGVAYEMTLDGDPGLSVNQYPKPDYAIDETSVFFTPENITAGVDSFAVNVIVTNLGKAIKDSIAIQVKRIYSDPTNTNPQSNQLTLVVKKNIPAPYYKDTIVFKMPTQISNLGYGQNYFDVLADADHHIAEMAECNNGIDGGCPSATQHSAQTYIQNDDIIPIYPYEFAIVPDSVVTLKASTVDPFAPYHSYRIQVDTSELFLHPLKDTTIFHSGGVVQWKISYPLRMLNGTAKDSTVYYWRVAKDTAVLSAAKWHYTSFIYLKGEYPGWNQSHYFQWKKDDFLNMNYDDTTNRVFKFPSSTNNVHVLTGWTDAVGGNLDYSTAGWYFNNAEMYFYRMGGCGYANPQFGNQGGLTFAVINNVTGEPWESLNINPLDDWGDQFGNYHCHDKTYFQYAFDFSTTGSHPLLGIAWSQVIQNFINAIPNGYYVLMYSMNRPPYTQWNTQLVQTLQSLGFQQADSFQQGLINGPIIFFTQKGNSSPLYFDYHNGYSVPIEASINFVGAWNRGEFTSPQIGPAYQWGSVHWKHFALENPTYDKDTLDIIGERANGIDTVLISTTNLDNIITNQISATAYPYLRLRLRTQDDSLRTPTQMLYWRVLFKKPPEAAIDPSQWFVVRDSIMNIGQTFHVEVALQNVTNITMDSMLTKYTVRDAYAGVTSSYIRYDSLRALDTLHLVYNKPLNGTNFTGINQLVIEANPNNDQLEQYHFNNFAEINFTGRGDKINPLLDVTFDNQHILDGDIVSAKPDILITLKDENKYLPLNNSDFVNVYLKYPNQTVPQQINYDGSTLTFYPPNASSLQNGNNKAQVEFKPALTLDGTYELLIKDRDSSGNTSNISYVSEGNVSYDYKISFQVINKPMITNVLNYPNPFTTSTKFIFTITGSEIPDIMKIQIMTIKGTVVKEITKEELGELHIGRNISQYAWDGRDQYGDLLANGVYFYNVVARLDDKRMDHLSESYDKYFKKGFGKLVIIR